LTALETLKRALAHTATKLVLVNTNERLRRDSRSDRRSRRPAQKRVLSAIGRRLRQTLRLINIARRVII